MTQNKKNKSEPLSIRDSLCVLWMAIVLGLYLARVVLPKFLEKIGV